MLNKLVASRLERRMGNGRTTPCLITCEGDTASDQDIQLVVKFSAGCFEKEKNLAIEAIAAMLAADLELPVPEPFLVATDDAFIESISDSDLKSLIHKSNRVAFGSKLVPNGFGAWIKNGRIPEELTQTAAEVFLFDNIIINADRRPNNPNCLTNGGEIAIFDHELSFGTLLLWKEPWHENGFDTIADPENHIFAPPYFEKRPTELDRFIAAWKSIPPQRFLDYCQALPPEWDIDVNFLNNTVTYLVDVQNRIDDVVRIGLEKLK